MLLVKTESVQVKRGIMLLLMVNMLVIMVCTLLLMENVLVMM